MCNVIYVLIILRNKKKKALTEEGNFKTSQTAVKDQQATAIQNTANIEPATETTTNTVKEMPCQETSPIRHRKASGRYDDWT